MDRIKKLKIKKQDGTFSDYIPIGADAENIDTTDGESVQLKLNKKPYYYNNVADMKADNKLKAGDMAITLGYYEANDGGGAEYKIVNGNYIDDGGSYHQLNNNLFAELIITDNKVNVKNFGAKGNDLADETNAFISLINYCNANLKNLYIPIGKYRIYNNLPAIYRGLCIIGEDGNRGLWLNENRPLIRDMREANTSEYLIKYNSTDSSIRLGTSIFNIIFYTGNIRNLNCINFDMEHGCYESIIENVSFIGFLRALTIQRGDDMTLKHVTINDCGGKENNSNIYAISIDNSVVIRVIECMIEHSRWMLKTQAGTAHLIIRDCHFEIAKHNIGYLGDPPIVIDRGLITGNSFVTRPIQTLATEMNIDNLNDVYYFLSVNKNVKIINNSFTTGGSNDGTLDTNKKQGKFLTVSDSEDHGNITIINNSFLNAAFEVPAISMRYIPNVCFSNNTVSILIEEHPALGDSIFKDYFVIDNIIDTIVGQDNLFNIQNNFNVANQLDFLPRLTRTNNLLYSLYSQYYKTSTNKYSSDTYRYGNNATSISKIPTLVIQGDKGFFELEIFDKNATNLYYKGIITFDIRTGSASVLEKTNLIKNMEGATINFIKQKDNKLLIQLINSAKDSLVFKINNASKNVFAYKNNSFDLISENIIYSIS